MWFLIILGLGTCSYGHPIIGGTDVGTVVVENNKKIVLNSNKYPFAVSIYLYEILFKNTQNVEESSSECAGMLISRSAVLTAAHCLTDFIKEPTIEITAGMIHSSLETETQVARGNDYVIHDDFLERQGKKFLRNGIGIIWTNEKFTLSLKVSVGNLAAPFLEVENKMATILGWGLTERGRYSEMLKHGRVELISRSFCQTFYDDTDVSSSMICALAKKRDIVHCTGDSGGPLVVDGTIVGIASFSGHAFVVRRDGRKVKVCDPRKPGVFTKVAAYRSWITENVHLGPPRKRHKSKVHQVNKPTNRKPDQNFSKNPFTSLKRTQISK